MNMNIRWFQKVTRPPRICVVVLSFCVGFGSFASPASAYTWNANPDPVAAGSTVSLRFLPDPGCSFNVATGGFLGRALVIAHVFVAYNYVAFFATWRALFRILSGKHGWAKTGRLKEPAASGTRGGRGELRL